MRQVREYCCCNSDIIAGDEANKERFVCIGDGGVVMRRLARVVHGCLMAKRY